MSRDSRGRVTLRHSETGATYDAPASAVGHLAVSGWEPADEPAEQTGTAPTPGPALGVDASGGQPDTPAAEDKTTRRRRTKED